MKIVSIIILGSLVLFSHELFAQEEINLFALNNIDDNTAVVLKSFAITTEQLYTHDSEFNHIKVNGVILKVAPKSGMNVVRRLRGELLNTPYQSYFYDNKYGYGNDEIAIVKTKNDIDYLKMVRTDGINYDLTADDVLTMYKEWNNKYDLHLVGAGRDWIEARVKKENIDWRKFSKEVFAFCPDVVIQGTGTVEGLEIEMKNNSLLYLWWD